MEQCTHDLFACNEVNCSCRISVRPCTSVSFELRNHSSVVLIISGKDASDEESSQYPPVGIAHLLDEIGGLVRQQFECLRNAVTFEYGTISVTIGEPAFNLLLIDIGPAGMIKVVAQCSYHKSKCMMLVKGRQKSGISSESVGSVHDSHSMMNVVEGVADQLVDTYSQPSQ